MKQLLLLEYLSGGGALEASGPTAISDLGPEGFAMLSALAQDWGRLPDWKVKALVHRELLRELEASEHVEWMELSRSLDWELQWQVAAESADAIIVIAPECDQRLQRAVDLIDAVTHNRIGCRGDFLRNASDKWLTAECLKRFGVPHPNTMPLDDWLASARDRNDLTDWVRKPRDGVDAVGIEFLTADRTMHLNDRLAKELVDEADCGRDDCIAQQWLEGEACSVAAWIQHGKIRWFPPVYQSIERRENKLHYRGGYGPLPQDDWPTVFETANLALNALGEGAEGWVGIDFVLRRTVRATEVVIIELNPRWTTSYIGLRAMLPDGCLPHILSGGGWPLPWSEQELVPVRWNCSGVCQ